MENKAATKGNGKQGNRFVSEFPIDVTFKRADIFQFYARETNIRQHKVVGSSHLNSEALVSGLS